MLFAPSLRAPDATGTEVEIATFRAGDVPDMRHPAARAALARLRSRAASERRPGARALSIMIVIGMSIACAMAPAAMIILTRSLRLPPYLTFIALFGGIAASIGCIGFLSTRLVRRSLGSAIELVVEAILAMGRCASCGYPMDAIPDDGDGVQRCPECGASWRSALIGREAVPSATGQGSALVRGTIVTSAMSRARRRDDRGRPFEPLTFFHVADEEAKRRRRPIERAARPSVLLAIATPTAIAVVCIGALLLFTPAPVVVVGMGLVVAAGTLALFALVGGSARRTIYLELRRRMCPACYCRLRREGDMLVCPRCDGAWKRPPRR
ncbi:MAG: hypothetical protein JNM94_04605 [Phycisphaerae bacterium]|nr:hypothetical protein [Phycisphaerae bacterium]